MTTFFNIRHGRENLMSDEEQAGEGHNLNELKRDLAMAAGRILELERQRATINEEISQVKRDHVKKHMPLAAFQVAYKLYKMERELDEDGQVKTQEEIDNIRIAFEALKPGGQGDLFPDGVAPAKPEDAVGDFGEDAVH